MKLNGLKLVTILGIGILSGCSYNLKPIDKNGNPGDKYGKEIIERAFELETCKEYSRNAKYDKALKCANNAIEKYGNNSATYEARAGIYSLMKEYDKAINDLELANKYCNSKNPNVYNLEIKELKQKQAYSKK